MRPTPGWERVLLPAIDSESHERLFGLCRSHPERCVPMIGLHPTSVNDNPHWREELALVERYLETPPAGIRFCAVGEIGLDLYWSRDFRAEQLEAFRRQIDLSLEYGLPIAVHTRDAWPETVELMREYKGQRRPGRFPRLFGHGRHLPGTEGVRRLRLRNRRGGDVQKEQAGRGGAGDAAARHRPRNRLPLPDARTPPRRTQRICLRAVRLRKKSRS